MTNENTGLSESDSIHPIRPRSFVRFFRRYMDLSALVVAALPIPVSGAGLLPIFDVYRSSVTTYASLFCFLVVAFVFYVRHRIARRMFGCSEESAIKVRKTTLAAWPAVCILVCIGSVFLYQWLLDKSIRDVIPKIQVSVFAMGLTSPDPKDLLRSQKELEREVGLDKLDLKVIYVPAPTTQYILERTRSDQLRYGMLLIGLHLLIYISAVGAFALMSLREYLIELFQISEIDLAFASQESS